MDTPMLSCSICPKRPNFSDTSHLLTHVGSKGHLAHLHKLQVRSHQEIAAGHQLATYNQWYQHYGLGQLLSERLQQKDSKSTTRRNRARPVVDHVKDEEVVAYGDAANFALVSPDMVKPQASPRRRPARPSRRVKRQITPDSDSDYESSPIKRNRRWRVRMPYSSPAKASTSGNIIDSSDADCFAEDDYQPPSTPENSKLKGVVWPGMHLFDAATMEMRRKRNQKKDGSVLKKMERTSAMIEPTEVIYSAEGTMIKERYIDGNVNESSPLLGEMAIPKPSVRKRRQPLATLSSNVTAKRSIRARRPGKPDIFQERPPNFRSRLRNIPSSSTNVSLESTSRFSPTEDENVEFKLTIDTLTHRKRPGNFTIFNENSDRYPQSTVQTMKKEGLVQPPGAMHVPVHTIPPRPQLSFLTAPWLQPQYQLPAYYNNSHVDYRPPPPAPPFKPYQQTYGGKENSDWTTAELDFGHDSLTSNPLGFQWPGSGMQQNLGLNLSPVHNRQSIFVDEVSQFDDPFSYGKNPLSAAFGHFEKPPMTSSECMKQRAVSPDGTVSDHDTTGC